MQVAAPAPPHGTPEMGPSNQGVPQSLSLGSVAPCGHFQLCPRPRVQVSGECSLHLPGDSVVKTTV